MHAFRRCVSALALGVSLATAGRAQSFVEVQAAVAGGDYRAARSLAERIEPPAERARALVWVDYGARDYVGAALAAYAGLRASPDDVWLAERAAAAALAQRDGAETRLAVGELERIARALSAGPEREQWLGTSVAYRAASDELVALEAAARRARVLGIATVITLLAAAAVMLTWCLRRGASAHLEQA